MNWSPIRTLFAERTKHQGESYGPHASSSHKFNENYDTSFVLTCFRFWLLDLSEYVGFLGRVSYGFCKNFDAMTWVCVFIILKHQVITVAKSLISCIFRASYCCKSRGMRRRIQESIFVSSGIHELSSLKTAVFICKYLVIQENEDGILAPFVSQKMWCF